MKTMRELWSSAYLCVPDADKGRRYKGTCKDLDHRGGGEVHSLIATPPSAASFYFVVARKVT